MACCCMNLYYLENIQALIYLNWCFSPAKEYFFNKSNPLLKLVHATRMLYGIDEFWTIVVK